MKTLIMIALLISGCSAQKVVKDSIGGMCEQNCYDRFPDSASERMNCLNYCEEKKP